MQIFFTYDDVTGDGLLVIVSDHVTITVSDNFRYENIEGLDDHCYNPEEAFRALYKQATRQMDRL